MNAVEELREMLQSEPYHWSPEMGLLAGAVIEIADTLHRLPGIPGDEPPEQVRREDGEPNNLDELERIIATRDVPALAAKLRATEAAHAVAEQTYPTLLARDWPTWYAEFLLGQG